MEIIKKEFQPTYKRENGLWVLNVDSIEFPHEFQVHERSLVYLPPKQIGGNHRHPRIEILIGIGDLEFCWLNDTGKLQKMVMNENGELSYILIPPFVPHAVLNVSQTNSAMLFEYANAKQYDVEAVQVVQ